MNVKYILINIISLNLYLLLSKSPEVGGIELLVTTSDFLVVFGKDITIDAEQESSACNVLSVGTISQVNSSTWRYVNLVVRTIR